MGVFHKVGGFFGVGHKPGEVTTTRRPKRFSRKVKMRPRSGFEFAELGELAFFGGDLPVIGIVFFVIGAGLILIGITIGMLLVLAILVELFVIVAAIALLNAWAWIRKHPKHAVVLFDNQLWTRPLQPGELPQQDQLQLDAGQTPRERGYSRIKSA